MRTKFLLVALLLFAPLAHAAKVRVELTTPTQNTDGTPLTDLSRVTVEWGSCAGQAFGQRQAAVTISTAQTGTRLTTFIYPTGLGRVCARAYAINSAGVSSEPSNVAWKDLVPRLGQPVILGQAIELTFKPEETEDAEASGS